MIIEKIDELLEVREPCKMRWFARLAFWSWLILLSSPLLLFGALLGGGTGLVIAWTMLLSFFVWSLSKMTQRKIFEHGHTFTTHTLSHLPIDYIITPDTETWFQLIGSHKGKRMVLISRALWLQTTQADLEVEIFNVLSRRSAADDRIVLFLESIEAMIARRPYWTSWALWPFRQQASTLKGYWTAL